MTLPLVIQALAAVYLVASTSFITASGGLNTLVFKAAPLLLGVMLGFYTIAKFMGWPA